MGVSELAICIIITHAHLIYCDSPDTRNAPPVALTAPLAVLGPFHVPAPTQQLAHDEVVEILKKKTQFQKSAQLGE